MDIHQSVSQDVDLANLRSLYEQAVAEQDLPFGGRSATNTFLRAVEAVDWNSKDAETFHDVIHMAISLDAVRLARRLANLGHELHPDSDDLRRAALVLAPPRVIRRDLPGVPGLNASIDWFRDHRYQYRGLWVAIKAGELIGTGPTYDTLVEQIGPFSIADHVIITRMG